MDSLFCFAYTVVNKMAGVRQGLHGLRAAAHGGSDAAPVRRPATRYSLRSTSMGSTRVARRAGSQLAAVATARRMSMPAT